MPERMNEAQRTLDSFEISESAKAIQNQLHQLVCQSIHDAGGKISFSQFMSMALYQPTLGYYQNDLQKFGDKGDYVTAPEMGRLFAQCIANSISKLFKQGGELANQSILEIGAGSGSLVINLMQSLHQLNALPSSYLILEPSSSLQKQQREKVASCIPEISDKVQWISELPRAFNGVILANEVIDAIPFERVKKDNGQWRKLGVGLEFEQLTNSLMNPVVDESLPGPLVAEQFSEEYVDGYTTEYRPLVNGWIKSLSSALNTGAIMLIDYGYAAAEFYHPQRSAGSLNCFIRHHQHDDPYQLVGLQDITAHVDFTQVALAASKNELNVDGFTTQAGFLLENGITQIAEQQNTDVPAEVRYQRSRELQQLLMPGQMGEVIKVILLSKSLNSEISGFSMQDHLHRL